MGLRRDGLGAAASDLATVPFITAAGIDDLHHVLLSDEQHRGQRTVQNRDQNRDRWQRLAPPQCPVHVPASGARQRTDGRPGSVRDGGTHAVLIHAALVHAQFDTIHPHTDGNGRVGRALIHTVLTGRGRTPRRCSRSAWCRSLDPMLAWTVSPPTATTGQRPRPMSNSVWKHRCGHSSTSPN